jgi:peptidylprolyl isomerase
MALGDGEFALVEYTLRVKETGEVIDTTSEEEAKKAGVYDSKERYGPRLVIVGEGRLIEGLEEAVKQLEEGQEVEIEIPPEKGFGKRDASKIKILPKSQFLRNNIIPEPGKIVEINGQLAIIRSVTGGRVVVDFNHPLAGKTLTAKVKLVKVLKSPQEKLLHLMLRRLPAFVKPEDVKVEYDAAERYARYVFNEKALLVQDMQVIKRIVVAEVKKFMSPEVRKLDFVEKVTIVKEEPEKQEEKTGEAGTAQAAAQEAEAGQQGESSS